MKIPPSYIINNKIVLLLTKIEANKTYLQTVTIPELIANNLMRVSLLKSSVYSAQIEGNSLTMDDVESLTEEDEKQFQRQEVENIISAISFMRDKGVPEQI